MPAGRWRVGLLGNRDFMDTPFNITSYTAEMSGELLNETLFLGLDDARAKIASWFADYNIGRPHSALRYLSSWLMPPTAPQCTIGCAT